jgi:cyclic dehypoxanthinyl futalosine synthase
LEATELLTRAPQLELMERAQEVRQILNPGTDVTFVIDTNPNYTNACVTACTFCSFYRKPGSSEVYVVEPEQLAEDVARAAAEGATTVLLQGGHHPDLPLEYYFDLLRAIRKAVPTIHLHPFSPAEVLHISESCGVTVEDILKRLVDVGVRTMPGGGAEILVDSVRKRISPKKISSEQWLTVMRQAHALGIRTTATMTYGHVEDPADLVAHFEKIRALQEETGGFYAFIPWSFKPGHSPLSRLVPAAELSSYYVRVIAVARLMLENVAHIQASWFGEGWRAGQLALHAGADDFGGLLLEENVLNQAEHSKATTLNNVLTIIREAGFTPVQRTTEYRKIRSYDDSGTEPHGSLVSERKPARAIPAQKFACAR